MNNDNNISWDDHLDDDAEEVDTIPPVTWKERLGLVSRKKRLGTSEATQEWLIYYKNLYTEKAPSVELYSRLLARNGVWSLPNPYREGHPLFYAYYADGVFLKDVDVVLSSWEQRFISPNVAAQDTTTIPDTIQSNINKISRQWNAVYMHRRFDEPGRSIIETEKENSKQWHKKQRQWEAIAQECLVQLFSDDPSMWSWMKQELHIDNIRLLCKIIYDVAPVSKRHHILTQWQQQGWVSSSELKWFEKSQH